MFPKPVRRILYLFILVLVGLNLFRFVRDHTTQEVIAIKLYSRALLDRDVSSARHMVSGTEALEPFSNRKKRDDALRGNIRWVTYKIKEINRGEKTTTLNINQIIRLDRPGQSSFWGTQKIINNFHATMISHHSSWKVRNYRDRYYQPGMKE